MTLFDSYSWLCRRTDQKLLKYVCCSSFKWKQLLILSYLLKRTLVLLKVLPLSCIFAYTNLITHEFLYSSSSLLNESLLHDKLWGPSQRVVTLLYGSFNHKKNKKKNKCCQGENDSEQLWVLIFFTHILGSSVSGHFLHQFFCVEFPNLLIFFESRYLSVVFSFIFLSTHMEENLIIKIWNGWIVCVCTLWSEDTCVSGDQLHTTIQSFVCFPTPYIPAWSLQCISIVCLAICLETICIVALSVVVHRSTHISPSV